MRYLHLDNLISVLPLNKFYKIYKFYKEYCYYSIENTSGVLKLQIIKI
jgi:hypothetical protein